MCNVNVLKLRNCTGYGLLVFNTTFCYYLDISHFGINLIFIYMYNTKDKDKGSDSIEDKTYLLRSKTLTVPSNEDKTYLLRSKALTVPSNEDKTYLLRSKALTVLKIKLTC